jgi:DNA-binding MarR family transcriptional regulator
MEPTTTGTGTITALTRLSKLVRRRTPDDVLGIRMRDFWVLSYLMERDGVAQQDLADAMMIDANNLVLLLNEMEAAGFVLRRRDPDDRRRHIVEVTDEGRKAFARAERGREVIEDDVLSALSAEERETLRRLLIKALEG